MVYSLGMNINKILHWVTLIGLFAIPFLPLIVSSGAFFPFITGKNFAFRAIIEIIFATWLILALRDKSYWPKRSYLLYSVLALLAITGLATLFGENLYRSFWSNYERMGGYISLLHLGAYFIVLISFLKSKTEWFWLANTAIIANWFIAIYSVLQLAGRIDIHQGGVRLDATLGNATYLAVYVLFGIFISLYLLSQVKNNGLRVLYGLTALIDLFLLYNTATRGTILGLIAGLIVFAGLVVLRGEKRHKQWAGGILLAVMILVGGFFLVKETSFVQNSPVLSRFASISMSEATTQSRFLIWNMSLKGAMDHPLLGWGPENYQMVFSKYYEPAMWRQEPWFDRSHNIFFDWLIDAGLLGLLAYLSIFLSAFYYLWLRRERFGFGGYILVGLIVAYLIHNIFVFDNLISYLYFFAVMAYINFLSTEEESEPVLKTKKNYQLNKKNKITDEFSVGKNTATILIVILLVASLYYLNYRPWQVSRNLISAIRPDTSPDKSLIIFQDIFSKKTFGSAEVREQLISKTSNLINEPEVPNDLKLQFVKLASDEIKTHFIYFPEDTRAYLFFGSFFSNIGNLDQGLEYLSKAKELSPKKQQILFELAGIYVRQQDAPKALASVKEAYDLDPANIEARKLYALVLFMTGQNNLANEIISPIKKDPTYYEDPRFINLYQQMGATQLLQELKDLAMQKNKK